MFKYITVFKLNGLHGFLEMRSNIQEYLSDEEENTEEVNTIRRNKRRQRKWEIVSIFNTKEEAINAINIDAIWSFHYRNKTIERIKQE